MYKKFILGIDCGTQSTKVVVFDFEGKVITSAKKSISLEKTRSDWAEQDAEEWWTSLCSALRTVTDKIDKKDILGLAIAYQRETFVSVDSNYHPLRKAFLWMDQRATKEAEEVRNVISESKFTNITGKFLNPTPSIMKIKWIKNNEPEIWEKIDKIMTVGAYINYKLTGKVIDAAAGADTTGLYNINTNIWSDELLSIIDLRENQLFDVLPSGSKAGNVTKQAARKTGLSEGTPVFLAGGDGQVFAVGVGAIKESEMAISVGTSGTCDIHGSKIDLKSGSRALASCIKGLYVHESVLMSAANNVSWFIRNFENTSQEKRNSTPESVLDKAIEKIPPCSDGLMTIPYLRGCMMPYNDPNTRGATLGWSDIHTKLHFYKSILEGIAFEIRLIINNYEKNSGVTISSITVGGGGAASNKWLQIIADIIGENILVSDTTENTALGAAIMSAYGLKVYESVDLAVKKMCRVKNTFIPEQGRLKLYNKFFNEVYKEVYPAIRKYLKYLGRFDVNSSGEK
jgi:xylulokinase